MGCDIHAVLQKKTRKGWETTRILDIERNYALFYVLAGVRGYGGPMISHPRGLPIDVELIDNYYLKVPDKVYQYYAYENIIEDKGPRVYMGEHSFSYLGIDEILAFKPLSKPYSGYEFLGEVLPAEITNLFLQCIPQKNYRIVFGFDS